MTTARATPPRVRPRVDGDLAPLPRRQGGSSLVARGEPMLWLTGGGLVLCCVMILGLLGLIFYQGFRTFWPTPVVSVTTLDGRTLWG